MHTHTCTQIHTHTHTHKHKHTHTRTHTHTRESGMQKYTTLYSTSKVRKLNWYKVKTKSIKSQAKDKFTVTMQTFHTVSPINTFHWVEIIICSKFIFRKLLARDSAPIVFDDEQGDLFSTLGKQWNWMNFFPFSHQCHQQSGDLLIVLPPMLTVPSWSFKAPVMILFRKMLKRVGQSRHLCRTPIVVQHQSPMLPLKKTVHWWPCHRGVWWLG